MTDAGRKTEELIRRVKARLSGLINRKENRTMAVYMEDRLNRCEEQARWELDVISEALDVIGEQFMKIDEIQVNGYGYGASGQLKVMFADLWVSRSRMADEVERQKAKVTDTQWLMDGGD